ncbi:MAG: nucleotidyl transferase AbiEii/AbiGii toxin family protein [Proteobacteria bacterium]|nr:nucleotidyl transferase AbiEii/AbiGii toxin family protein [Pseudomonadota bacterium]
MNLNAEYLERLATEAGFRPETLEKVIRLGELAADIGRHPLLSRALVLKGGTALNLMFGPPARLSVDLDFNYVGHEDRKRAQEQRPEVERAIEIIAQAQGYRIQRSRDAHAGRKTYLSYAGAAGTPDRIEIDLNFLFRVPLGEMTARPLWQPPGVVTPEVRVVSVDELFAGKLRATLDRAMPRDLFDTIRLPGYAAEEWATPRLRRIHVALAATLPRPLYEYGEARLDRVTDRVIQEQLTPMLHRDERPTAGELKQQAWSVLAPLVTLDDAEREYIDRVHAGELLPELLFPDDEETAGRLKRHPALQWKIDNVRRYQRR